MWLSLQSWVKAKQRKHSGVDRSPRSPTCLFPSLTSPHCWSLPQGYALHGSWCMHCLRCRSPTPYKMAGNLATSTPATIISFCNIGSSSTRRLLITTWLQSGFWHCSQDCCLRSQPRTIQLRALSRIQYLMKSEQIPSSLETMTTTT